MRSISQYLENQIFEASGKPSDIKKYKQSVRKETVNFKSSDVYDFSDSGYDEEFKYFDGSGNGYIKDKEGHVYDVVTWEHQGDAGRIAGGSRRFGVTIKKANGKDDFEVDGWMAVFSKGSNTQCVSDIKAGYYLEDYIAKYIGPRQEEKFGGIAKKGDANAVSFTKGKELKQEQDKAEFNSRYVCIPQSVYWEIDDNGLKIIRWYPAQGKETQEYNILNAKKNSAAYNSDEWKKLSKEIDELQEKLNEQYLSIFKPTVIEKIKEVFKTTDLNKLRGIGGYFAFASKNQYARDSFFAIDTKTSKIVAVDLDKSKVVKRDLEFSIGDIVSINKSKMSPEAEKLFKATADAWKKTEGRKQTEYIEKNWERLANQQGKLYWETGAKKLGTEEAKKEYQELLRKHDWDKNNRLEFSLSLVQDYIEGDLPDSEGVVEKPLSNPEPSADAKKSHGKDTKMSNGANKDAYDKMKAWHNGERKQNLSNCSDAKLKMNYKVCKELGYDKEMELIKKEAENRGIDINESLSLQDFINESMLLAKDY